MAPDRGDTAGSSYQSISNTPNDGNDDSLDEQQFERDEERRFLAQHADEQQNFTIRGILVGLGVGLVVCFSNMYFGLQSQFLFFLIHKVLS
jgi:hypothetical protein